MDWVEKSPSLNPTLNLIQPNPYTPVLEKLGLDICTLYPFLFLYVFFGFEANLDAAARALAKLHSCNLTGTVSFGACSQVPSPNMSLSFSKGLR